MHSRDQILESLRSLKAELISRYPIVSLAIFGSVAREDQNPDSDVDILVEFDGKVGSEFFNLADELESALERKVDLVSKKGIKPKYFSAIQTDLIYV